MKIEHLAFNVADPVAMAAWYVEHCGLRVALHIPEPVQAHFLTDGAGSILEIYCNPPDQVPDYRSMDPLLLHLALSSDDPVADAERLVGVGAEQVQDLQADDGSRIIMLRDPWGLALQLCRRTHPLCP